MESKLVAESLSNVNVCIRIRPPTIREKHQLLKSCIRLSNPHKQSIDLKLSSEPSYTQITVGKDRTFTFDTILGAQSTQQVSRPLYAVSLADIRLLRRMCTLASSRLSKAFSK